MDLLYRNAVCNFIYPDLATSELLKNHSEHKN